jgi:hypothetical protein
MTESQRTLVVTGVVLLGGFLLGKNIVGDISARRERARQGLPREQVAQKEALDDTVKFLGSIFGIWTIAQQAPDMVVEAQKLLASVE